MSIEDRLNNIFVEKQELFENELNIDNYILSLVKEINHRVLCKNSDNFELWLKINKPENIKIITHALIKVFQSSTFTHKSPGLVVNYILCEINVIDIALINNKSYDNERNRYEVQTDILKQLTAQRTQVLSTHEEKMNNYQQAAFDLQKKRDKEIAEAHSRYLIAKKEIEDLLSICPKEHTNTMNELNDQITLLSKCSHGFNYSGTVFNN